MYGRWHDEQDLGDGFDEGVLPGMDLGDTEIHPWGWRAEHWYRTLVTFPCATVTLEKEEEEKEDQEEEDGEEEGGEGGKREKGEGREEEPEREGERNLLAEMEYGPKKVWNHISVLHLYMYL